MQIELKRIQHEVGITFIHVTHDQEEAMTMADRIAVMNEGRVERLGSPTEIYDDPRSEFVAGFLGASNLMDADVVDAAAGVVSIPPATKVQVPAGALSGIGRAVRIGVRPEKIHLAEPGTAGLPANTLSARVLDTSFIGVSTGYLLTTPAGATLSVVVQNLAERRFAPGEEVVAAWLPEHTFVVDDR